MKTEENKMKRSNLEKYLDKNVEVIMLDGDTYTGTLYKTSNKMFTDNPSLYLKKDYYFCSPPENSYATYYLFRSSHVKKIKIL